MSNCVIVSIYSGANRVGKIRGIDVHSQPKPGTSHCLYTSYSVVILILYMDTLSELDLTFMRDVVTLMLCGVSANPH